jgi:hypothetical protein
MTSVLRRLETWYLSNCDGDWEHQFGVEIETLDNPGWRVKIDVTNTELESAPFSTREEGFSDQVGWLRCWKTDAEFHAVCGPERL